MGVGTSTKSPVSAKILATGEELEFAPILGFYTTTLFSRASLLQYGLWGRILSVRKNIDVHAIRVGRLKTTDICLTQKM